MTADVTMDWPDAMRACKDGLSVRRQAWDDPLSFVQMHDGKLMLRHHGTWHEWLVSEADVYARDWVV